MVLIYIYMCVSLIVPVGLVRVFVMVVDNLKKGGKQYSWGLHKIVGGRNRLPAMVSAYIFLKFGEKFL